jgi:hypothetical protein
MLVRCGARLRLIALCAGECWRHCDRHDRLTLGLVVLVVSAILWALPPRLLGPGVAAMLAGAIVQRRYAKRRQQELEHLLILLTDAPDKE